MSKINKSVEMVISTNKHLSSMSLQSRLEIKRILEDQYHTVRMTDVNSGKDIDKVIARKPDLVFLGMKFVYAEPPIQSQRIWLTQRLSEAGIAFTGSGMAASILEHNKQLAKHRAVRQGLHTAKSMLIKYGERYTATDIDIAYPIFIKPVDGGGGSGINEFSLVNNYEELQQQITWLMDTCNTDALLESYLPGREFSVGILKKAGAVGYHVLPLELIVPSNQSGMRFLSSEIKQADSEETLAVTDPVLKTKLSVLALRVFKALEAQDYGRIDIRLDANDTPHFLEANLLPSLLNNYGNLPKASLMNINLGHAELILQIAELGLAKNNLQPSATIMNIDGPIMNNLLLPSFSPNV